MNSCTYLVLILMLFLGATSTQASPNALTYQGRIIKNDGHALEYNNVSFLFEITSPNGNCVIYREQRDGVNMINSGGVFDVPIGSGTKLFPTDPLFTLLDAFNNSMVHSCYLGSTYSASKGDLRQLKVQFHDGSGWKVISPSSEIRSVPYAAYALSSQKLGTKTEDDFFVKTGLPACAGNEFLKWNGTSLSCGPVTGASGGTVTSVTSGDSYVTITNSTSTPVVTLNVGTTAGTVASGDDGRFTDARIPKGAASGDLSGTYPNPSVAKLQGVPVSNTAPTSGHYLKYDGSQWLSAVIGIGDVTNLNSTLNTYLLKSTFDGYVASAGCAQHQTMYWSPVLGFQCQSINVSVAGDVSGSIGAVSVNKIKGVDVDTTGLTPNQVLKYIGGKWIPADDNNAGGTVTNIATGTGLSGGPITSTGTISLANTTVAPGIYGSGTQVGTFTVDAQGRLTTASNTAITFPVTSVATKTGAVVLDYGDINSATGKYLTYKPNDVACTDGQVIKWVAANSRWECANDTNAGGTVKNITTGTGLTGGPITDTGTISLANTTVTAGAYTRADITVDAQGRLIAATNGSAVNLTSDVTGVLPLANGGTGQTSALSAFNALSPLTTKGDILVRDGTNNIRLPLGANGQILSANSGQTSGLQWITPTNGTVTNVTGTAPIVVTNNTTTPAISVDDATPSAKGVVQVGAGIAVSAGTISADPATFPSTIPVSKGGTAATTFTANRLIASNGTGNALTTFNCAVGQLMTFDATGLMTCSSFTTGSVFLKDGNIFGSDATLGTNDNFALNFATNATPKMTILTNGSIGIGTQNPNSASALDVSSTTKGFLPPRMTKAQRDAIGSPTQGLIVFNTDSNTIDYYNGASWISLNGSPRFIKLTMSGYQGGLATDTIVQFNTIAVNNGFTTTGYGVNLKAGVVYRIEASLNTYAATGNNYLGYILTNGTTSIGASAYTLESEQTSYGFKASILEIYKPTTDQTIYVKISDPNIGTGQITPNYNTHLLVTELVPSGPGGGGADNLGNHTAIQNINLGSNWLSGNGTNQGLRIDTSGNVGLGTANPLFKLHVNGDSPGGADQTVVQIGNSIATGSGPLYLTYNAPMISGNSYFNSGWKYAGGNAKPATIGLAGGISFSTDDAAVGAAGAAVNFTTKMYINSNGNVGIGTGNPNYKLDVQGGGVNSSGGYTQVSDIRLKTNIAYLNSKEALNKISALNGIYYDWKDQAQFGQDHQVGLIAQDVQKVFPEAVKTNPEGFLSVSYSNLVAPVIEAIKELLKVSDEQSREIASVKADNAAKDQEIAKLKAENAEMKTRLDKIETRLNLK